MDRKNNNFVKTLKQANDSLLEMKTTQPSGADNLIIRMFENNTTYDRAFTIPAAGRISFYASFVFNSYLLPWQHSAYCVIVPQFWIDSLSSPYQGNDGRVNVLPPDRLNSVGGARIDIQAVNADLSLIPHTLYVKYYVLTSVLNGILSAST